MDSHLVHMMVQSQNIYKDPTCCLLGDMDGFTLGTYAGKKLGYLEVSTEGIAEGDFEVLLLGD